MREDHFTPVDIFNIISAIDSQQQFYDLYLAMDDPENDCCHSTVYGGDSFHIHQQWIADLMTKFRNGELDCFTMITITNDFDYLDLEPNDNEIRDNRLYVKFE